MFDKNIAEVMTAPVATLTLDASARDAAQRMRELDIGTVVVCENDKAVGVITDRDVTVRCTALGLDCSTTRVSAIMSRDLATIGEEATTKDAEKLMEDRQVRRLIVTGSDGSARGIV